MKNLMILVMVLFSSVAQAETKDSAEVEGMIKTLTKTSNPQHKAYARSIAKWSKHYGVEPKFVVAVIMTESSFNQKAISKTGDIGLGQINPAVWSVEFKRKYKYRLDTEKLRKDPDYNIQKTAQILAIRKNLQDAHWVGKYHSKTPSLKQAYYGRVSVKLNQLKVQTVASNP